MMKSKALEKAHDYDRRQGGGLLLPEEASSLPVTSYCRGQTGGWRLDARRTGRWLEAGCQ
jgi:hypothetical protein